MRIPVIKGTIKRRLLVNFRADPTVVSASSHRRFGPSFTKSIPLVGICLIRLEQIRPAGAWSTIQPCMISTFYQQPVAPRPAVVDLVSS